MLQRIVEGIKERTPPLRRAPRQPVYMKDAYVALLLRHYRECGLPEPEWIAEIPECPLEPPRAPPEREPYVRFSDGVVVMLTPDEEAGEVRVRLSGAIADLYHASYANAERPPIESLVRVYKHLGYSDKYLLDLLRKHDRHMERTNKIDLDKIFKADSGSKSKRAKKKDDVMLEEVEQVVDDDEDVEEDDAPVEDAFDMEVDDEDIELQDDDDEEYISE